MLKSFLVSKGPGVPRLLPPFSRLGGIKSLNVSELFPLQGAGREAARGLQLQALQTSISC
jgi:hypothetical protein